MDAAKAEHIRQRALDYAARQKAKAGTTMLEHIRKYIALDHKPSHPSNRWPRPAPAGKIIRPTSDETTDRVSPKNLYLEDQRMLLEMARRRTAA
jgi:hypothetical protein